MKKPPDNPEFARFTEAKRKIVTVSKTELQKRMEEEKTARKTGKVPSPQGSNRG